MGPDDIDAAWLNDALAERHPGARVADVEIVRVNEVTNTHVRLRLSYDEPAGMPELMFAKLPPLDPKRRNPRAPQTGFAYRREESIGKARNPGRNAVLPDGDVGECGSSKS